MKTSTMGGGRAADETTLEVMRQGRTARGELVVIDRMVHSVSAVLRRSRRPAVRGGLLGLLSALLLVIAPAGTAQAETPPIWLDIYSVEDASHDGVVSLGETVTYQFLVTNYTADELTGVSVSSPQLAAAGVTVTCFTRTLTTYDRDTCTATQTVTASDVAAGGISLTAQASGTSAGLTVTSQEVSTSRPAARPGLEMRLNVLDQGMDGVADLGESLSVEAWITNTGNTPLQDVTVDVPFLREAGISLSCGPTTLQPSDGAFCNDLSYIVAPKDVDAGQIIMNATAVAETIPFRNADGSSSTIQRVTAGASSPPMPTRGTPKPAVRMSAAALLEDVNRDGRAQPGEVLRYSFNVVNTGNTPLTGVAITDPLLADAGVAVACPTSSLQPGASMVCSTGRYVVSRSDAATGAVVSTATVHATPTLANGALGATLSYSVTTTTPAGDRFPRWRTPPAPPAHTRPTPRVRTKFPVSTTKAKPTRAATRRTSLRGRGLSGPEEAGVGLRQQGPIGRIAH